MPYSHAHGHYHLTRLKEMGRVYWCHSLGTIAASLVNIFIPVFLLKSGYSFQAVLVYLALQNLFAALLQVPCSKLFAYITPHYLMVVGHLFSGLLFGLLATLNSQGWPLLLLAFVWALHRDIYWTAFHQTFSLARSRDHASHQIAGIVAFNMLGVTAAPAIGGLVATYFGINYVYGAAIIILAVAILPMLNRSQGPPRTKLVLEITEIIRMRRDTFANFFNGMLVASELYLWPLFIFTIVSSYAGIGLLTAVIALTSVLVTLYVGQHEDKQEGRLFLKEGVAAYSLTSFLRMFAQSSLHILGINLLSGIGRALYVTPYMNRYYKNSDGSHRLAYITIMEMSFSFGNAVYLLVLLALSLILATQTVLLIGVGVVAILALGVRLMR